MKEEDRVKEVEEKLAEVEGKVAEEEKASHERENVVRQDAVAKFKDFDDLNAIILAKCEKAIEDQFQVFLDSSYFNMEKYDEDQEQAEDEIGVQQQSDVLPQS